MPFNHDLSPSPIDVSKIYGFEIIAFPPSKPKYENLKRRLDRDGLIFYEDTQGVCYCESKSSQVKAKVTLFPNLGGGQTKTYELVFCHIGLGYKYNSRKEIANFGRAISSLVSWKHKIVWITDDGKVAEWKGSSHGKSFNP